MRGVLDTCVLYDDLAMTGLRSRTLLEHCRLGTVAVSVPAVVVLEMVNHARERVTGALDRIDGGRERLARLGLGSGPSPRIDQRLVGQFEQTLRGRLDAHRVDVPDLPPVPHRTLVTRSIAGRKPFRKSDKGYRDTLIWHNVMDAARHEDLALVTSNTEDFADASKRALHQDLLEDLARMGRPGAVTLVTSLEGFLETHVPSHEQVLKQARRLLAGDPAFEESLRSRAALRLRDFAAWPPSSIDAALPGDDDERADLTSIDDVTLLAPPRIERAFPLGEDGVFVLELEVKAEVLFNLVFSPAAGERLAARGSAVDFYERSDGFWAGFTTGYVLGKLSASFDRDTNSVDDVDLDEVRELPDPSDDGPDATA